eukprot:5822171-Heterocapsa_arctica.AAC.1
MTWLEAKVLDQSASPVDRLVCGRLRLATGGSVRHDDCRKTPVGRLEWILHPTTPSGGNEQKPWRQRPLLGIGLAAPQV